MHLRLVQRVEVVGFIRRPDLGEDVRVFLAEVGSADTGADQHELGEAFGVLQGKIDGEHAAHRAPDEMRRFDVKLVHQREQVGHRGPARRGQLGPTESAHVGTDDVEVLRKGLDLRLPHALVGDARVEQEDREPFALALVVDTGAVDRRFHQTSAVSSALNFSSVSSSSRAGSESGITPTPA